MIGIYILIVALIVLALVFWQRMKNKDISKPSSKPSEELLKTAELPKHICALLTEDETIEKSFDLKTCEVYATNKRLLVKEGRTIRDFDYAHISSVAYSSKRYWWLIILGILFIVGSTLASWQMHLRMGPLEIGLILIIGLTLVIAGVVAKSERVEANVVGVPNPIKFVGSRQKLDSLLQIIRQRRIAKPIVVKTEARVTDVADTIRKLAQLRDEGILTQEEFEQKKSKLLQNPD